MKKTLKKTISIVLLISICYMLVPVISAYALSYNEIMEHMSYYYNKALKLSGRTSFNGYCGNCVGNQLRALGINIDYVGGNGNDTYDKYLNIDITTGGYKTKKYSASEFRLDSVLWDINNLNTFKGYTYTVLGFQTGSSSSSGQKYGHTLLIYAVMDGNIYYTESFGNSLRTKSISDFCNSYKDNPSTGCIEYAFEGAILFTNTPPPTPPPMPPSAPSIKVSATNFAAGSTITVSWGAVDRATGYDVTLTNNTDASKNQSLSVSGTSATFNVDNAGTYTVRATAKNQYGSSNGSNTVTICAHDPLTVTFEDYDGNELSTQKVKYGEGAKAPETPQREGYTFTGWSAEYSKVTTDMTITAKYKINTYIVKFIGRDGTILDTQKVDYGNEAIPPTPPEAPIGYTFSGWDTEDYKFVKKDLNVYAVYIWENNDLPIEFTTSPTVKRNEMGSGYVADMTLYNYPDITTDGKIVVVLKTSSGKMVASKTEAISLQAGEISTRRVFIPYDGVASTAEITIVAVIDNDKTGVPISKKSTIAVDLALEWSNWSETKPADTDKLIVEERTEYKYRTKSTTTSSSNTKSGWTLYDTTTSWGNWSDWYNYDPGSSSTRQTQTRYVPPIYKTQYKYSGYKSYSGHWHFCPTLCKKYNGSAYWIESDWQDWDIPLTYLSKPQSCACHGTFYGYYNDTVNHLYYKETRTVEATAGYTQWQYRDLQYTYHFYKWEDWSDWSTDAVSANNDREVKTRTVYRYKSAFSEDMEDNHGTERTISGKIENAEDGNQVTLYIFKGENTDPTESQLEYVAQSTLYDGGKYSFDYITKEEPNEQTGDFIIMVGVEGALSPFYVDIIKAPVPEYTVEFAVDGKTIDTQIVPEGEAAVVPPTPEKEGYTFIGWDTGITNIRDNMVINAIYTPNVYNVVFLDWDNSTVDVKTFKYGDLLTLPEPVEKEGSTFIGWDKIIEGVTTVTGNMIITAQYDINEYEVVFYDSDGSIISRQKVKYGESANIPGDPILEGYQFDKWSHAAELMSVKNNLNVYPEFKYEQTANAPIISAYETETSNQRIMLTSDDPEAIIYYTTDGSDPLVESSEFGVENVNGTSYSTTFEVEIGTIIKAISYINGKNTSDIVTYFVEEFTENDEYSPSETPPIIDTSKLKLRTINALVNDSELIAEIENYGIETISSAKAIIAAYGLNGQLINIKTYDISELLPGTTQKINMRTSDKAEHYKIFIWDSLKWMIPLGESTIVR